MHMNKSNEINSFREYFIIYRILFFAIISLSSQVSAIFADSLELNPYLGTFKVTKDSPTAESASPTIKFCGQWIDRTRNAATTVCKFQNISNKPISAFKARLRFLNDFNEVAGEEVWVYSSDIMHFDKNENRLAHPLIPPKQFIYLMTLKFNDGQRGFSSSMEVNPLLKPLKAKTEDELYAVQVKNKIICEPIKVVDSNE